MRNLTGLSVAPWGTSMRATMRTAIALTDGYLAFRDTILTRARREWVIGGQVQSETVDGRMMDSVKLRQRFPIALAEPIEQRTVLIYGEIHQHPVRPYSLPRRAKFPKVTRMSGERAPIRPGPHVNIGFQCVRSR